MTHEHEEGAQALTMAAYQAAAQTTAVYPVGMAIKGQNGGSVYLDLGMLYTALGLASEAGEYTNKVKKAIRDNGSLMQSDYGLLEALAHELGDLLWYVASASHEIGYSLEEIARMNMHKLRDRADRAALSGDGDQR